jgi:cell division cycle 14
MASTGLSALSSLLGLAQLPAEISPLSKQGKDNAVQQLLSGAPLVSKNMKPEHANVDLAVERHAPPFQTDKDSPTFPMHSVTNRQWPKEEDKKLRCCGDQMTLQGTLLPIIEGRLYLTSASSSAEVQPKKRELWVSLNKGGCYSPFCADFGPLNLGTTHRMCKRLHALLACPKHHRTKIIFCTSTEASDITNTVTLLGAFLCLRMGFSVAQAWAPFMGLHHSLIIPFRDATWAKNTFDLHVEDCLAGLQQAVSAGMYKQDEFCAEEYFYYDDPVQGDMHQVVPGKFIAFRGPVRDHGQAVTERGDSTLSASDYLDVFKDKNVSTIIRLNSAQYSSAVFKRAGFQHFDLPFEDCGVPSDCIVDKFLRIAEEAQGVVAVHCLAGLGRTGTLIALYLMKHHGFTAREVMGWIRICRPGSIIGPQQHYLEQQESRMHMLGVQGFAGLGDHDETAKMQRFPNTPARFRAADGPKSFRRVRSCELEMYSIKEEKRKIGLVSRTDSWEEAVPDAPSDCSFLSETATGVQPDSDMLARMVTEGMLRRDCLRLGCLSRSNTWDESDRKGVAPVSEAFQEQCV